MMYLFLNVLIVFLGNNFICFRIIKKVDVIYIVKEVVMVYCIFMVVLYYYGLMMVKYLFIFMI